MAALARCPVKGIVGYGRIIASPLPNSRLPTTSTCLRSCRTGELLQSMPSKLRYKLLPDHNIKLSDRKLILDILNTDFHDILM